MAAAKAVARPPPPGGSWESRTVDESFEVDPAKRFAGTVAFYSKLKGYGFVEMTQKGAIPNDTIFVHWRNINSDDRFPFLYKGLEVEFGMLKWKEKGKYTLRCKDITLPGGATVSLQDQVDAEKKTFVGAQDLRYSGTLKFYDPRWGYGYITVDDGYAGDVPKELRVERSEVNSGKTAPGWMQDLKVEFGIWKTTRNICKGYNMTLPGGIPITTSILENRQVTDATTFRGEVTMWNWRQGWGFVKPDPATPLPQAVQAKLSEQSAAATKKAESKGKTSSGEILLYLRRADLLPGTKLEQGTKVTYQVYTDDKGAGAFQVQVAA